VAVAGTGLTLRLWWIYFTVPSAEVCTFTASERRRQASVCESPPVSPAIWPFEVICRLDRHTLLRPFRARRGDVDLARSKHLRRFPHRSERRLTNSLAYGGLVAAEFAAGWPGRGETETTRTNGQYYPIARAAEIFTERWTPIIVRNLMAGCTTFSEISAGAPLRLLQRVRMIEVRPKPYGHGVIYLSRRGVGADHSTRGGRSRGGWAAPAAADLLPGGWWAG
jgi:hypothetical protein